MSTRTAAWLAWAVCALSLALIAFSFLLIALNLSLNAPIYFYWLEPTTIALGYSVIGAIIASRLPNHPIGWICCAIGFMGAVEHFSAALTLLAVILMAISPDVGLDILSSSDSGRLSLPNPIGIEGLPNLNRPVQTLVLALGLVAAASVVVGRRGARGVERQQIKWLLYAGAIWFVGNVLKNTVFSPLGEVSWGLWVGYLLVAVGGLGGPIAIGIAILRYRLYEIDTLINRTLVYGALSASLVLVYFGGVAAGQAILRTLT